MINGSTLVLYASKLFSILEGAICRQAAINIKDNLFANKAFPITDQYMNWIRQNSTRK